MKINGVDIGVISNVYSVSTESELSSALSSIGSGHGIIYLTDYITLTEAIAISGGGSIIIDGMGNKTGFDTGGDWKTFYITSVTSLVLRNFKIDSTDATTAANYTIQIIEGSDNPVLIDNLIITTHANSDGGVYINSNNVIVENCIITGPKRCIHITTADYITIKNNYFVNKTGDTNACMVLIMGGASNYLKIIGNHCINDTGRAIYIVTPVSYSIFSDNIIETSSYGLSATTADLLQYSIISKNIVFNPVVLGIKVYNMDFCVIHGNVLHDNTGGGASVYEGIGIYSGSDYNIIFGNLIYDFQNTGSDVGYGIHIHDANCDENTVVGNTSLNNKTSNISDGGTATFAASNNI